ncbi:MAG: hypothetical protein ACRDI2_11460, partial [Chloroflexota bacterium]
MLPGTLLTWSRERWRLKARSRQRRDSTHVLAKARATLAVTGGADGDALLGAPYAVAAPDWLRPVTAGATLRRV